MSLGHWAQNEAEVALNGHVMEKHRPLGHQLNSTWAVGRALLGTRKWMGSKEPGQR